MKTTLKFKSEIFSCLFSAFVFGFNIACLTAAKRLSGLRIGSSPDMPYEERMHHYNEQFPYVIMDAVLLGLLLMSFTFFIFLYFALKFKYGMNPIQAYKQYKEEKEVV